MSSLENFISIVVPVYNEVEVIQEFQKRVYKVLDMLTFCSEIIYVNDGSTDGTLDMLKRMQEKDARIIIVDLSRNYGKEIALTAGLDYASGNLAIPIDADLQDPPEIIPCLIEKWREGYNVVYARRSSRQGESWLKRVTAAAFYRVLGRVGGRVSIPADTGDFRLLDRKALDALSKFREQHRFMKGLFALIGFKQIAIDYERDERFAGETKWNYWRLWNLSLEGLTSFTIAPLKLSTYVGFFTALFAFLYGLYIFGKTIIVGDPVPGFPSIIVMVVFIGGMQLIVLGIIGEYLGRIFDETKYRPLYFVQDIIRKES
jgi:glycosyltransferase involved in cell wall biosynthesis